MHYLRVAIALVVDVNSREARNNCPAVFGIHLMVKKRFPSRHFPVTSRQNARDLRTFLVVAAPKPRVQFSALLSLTPTHTGTDYPPMGCCGSTANVHEDDQTARNVSGTEQISMQVRAQVPMPTPPPSALDPSPSNSSRRPRTHSQHSTRRSTDRSDAPSRNRAISAPQQVKPTKSSSSQHSQHSQHSSEPRKRANTSVGPRASRSTPRPPNPGEGDSWRGYEPLMTAL